MQQLILWEVMEDNPVTRHVNAMREESTEVISKALDNYFKGINPSVDMKALSGILVGAIYFHLIRKSKGTFCSIDFSTIEGQEIMAETITRILDKIYEEDKSINTARKPKDKGITLDIISECTGLPIEEIQKL